MTSISEKAVQLSHMKGELDEAKAMALIALEQSKATIALLEGAKDKLAHVVGGLSMMWGGAIPVPIADEYAEMNGELTEGITEILRFVREAVGALPETATILGRGSEAVDRYATQLMS